MALRRLLIVLSVLFAPLLAHAQTYPAPSVPLTGSEVIPCIQPGPHGAYKSCTTGNIGAVNLSITRAQIATTRIGNGLIQIGGYRTLGDLGAGALYRCGGSSTSTGIGAIQDAGGTWCNLFLNGVSNIGWFGAKADSGATTISAGDITANPQWRGCYTAATDTWDYVALQEMIYAALATASTPSVPGCTPTTPPASPPNIVWNAVTNTYLANNSTLVVPRGTYGVLKAATVVGTHFTYQGTPKGGSVLLWAGTVANTKNNNATILYCDACSYADIHNLTLQTNAGQSYGSVGPHLYLTWDGTYPGLKTQQITFYDFICITSLNGQCVLNGPSNAQGDTITCITCLFAGSNSDYAWQNLGSNALSTVFVGGNIQGFPHYGVMGNGGTYAIYGLNTENQNINCASIDPCLNQMDTYGSDFAAPGGVGTAQCNGVHDVRSESDVLAQGSASACMNVTASEVVGVDVVNWAANSVSWQGRFWHAVNTAGYTRGFMVVSAGGQDTPLPVTSVTAGTMTDSTQTWTVNQWAGFQLRYRIGNTQTRNCTIASNTATVITTSVGTCLSGLSGLVSDRYLIAGKSGGSAPSWPTGGGSVSSAGVGVGFNTTAGSATVCWSGINSVSVNDWVVIPLADNVAPGGGFPTVPKALYAQVVSKTVTSCGSSSGQMVLSKPAQYTLVDAPGYFGTGFSDGNLTEIPFDYSVISGLGTADDVRGVIQVGLPVAGQLTNIARKGPMVDLGNAYWGPLIDTNNVGQLASGGPLGLVAAFDNAARIGCNEPLVWAATIDLTQPAFACNTLGASVTSNATLNAPVGQAGQSQDLHLRLKSNGSSFTVTLGTNFVMPARFSSTFATGTSTTPIFNFDFRSDVNGWVETSGPNTIPISPGPLPTLSGTCTTNTQTGTNTTGTFKATCTAQTVIITFASTAPTGWSCRASDETTPADTLIQTAHGTGSCTLTGTTAAADVIVFNAIAF